MSAGALRVMPLLGGNSAQLWALGELMRQQRAAGTWPPLGPAHPPDPAQPTFTAIAEDHYRYTLPQLGIVLDLDRVRRDRHDLRGELRVRCERRAPARTGIDITADFTVGSLRSRAEWVRLLDGRTEFAKLDFGPDHQWFSVLESFCHWVRQADRAGEPAADLRTLPRPEQNDEIELDGIFLPRRHPSICFGDGGSLKSYLALLLAGKLAQQGMAVALFDWELSGEDHRDRLERLFPTMPKILYVRCERPLVYEVDRLRRLVKDDRVGYTVYDSVTYACDGPPEAAEVAGCYFRAVRQIGGGSLHIAHVTKNGDDQKPFGSAFWHNSARSTWFAQAAPDLLDETLLHLALYNRKTNLGPLRPPAGFTITFSQDRTSFAREEVADGKARKLTVRERMAALLRKGDMSAEEISQQIGASVETVKRTARRYKDVFEMLPDGRIGLDQSTAWMRETP